MSWNYRVIKQTGYSGDISYGIHEVYYHEDGSPWMYSTYPIGISWDDGENPLDTIERMKSALDKPTLTPEDFI